LAHKEPSYTEGGSNEPACCFQSGNQHIYPQKRIFVMYILSERVDNAYNFVILISGALHEDASLVATDL
jgi:hypothetical protein